MATWYLRNKFIHIAAILLSAFLYTTLALYNGFPFTFNNDTAIYIERGFTGQLRPDRPIIYGLFMAVVSMRYSLWLVVLTQALIVSLVVYLVFSYGSKSYAGNSNRFLFFYIGFTAFVSFCMGASFEVGWLMPDVFIAVAILCMALLICFKLKVRDTIIVSLILVLSIIVHNSHFFVCMLLCSLLLAGYIFRRIRLLYNHVAIKLKSILFVVVLAVVSNLLSSGIHYQYGGAFRSSFGGAIFFMSNLIEMGVVDPYLAENCETNNYRLCAYKDSIPNDFLWVSNSPLRKTGGWGKSNQSEFLAIEKDLLTTPKYLARIMYRSGVYTCKQFFSYDMEHVKAPTKYVNKLMRQWFKRDYKSFNNSRQTTKRIQFGLLEFAQNIAVGISCFFYCFVAFYVNPDRKLLLLPFFIMAALIMNAWFCSTFSGVYSRYQTRVVWLLPLPLFILAVNIGGLKYCKTGKTEQ